MQPSIPQSERQRVLQEITFQENQVLTRDLPRDTVLKGLQLRLSGAVTTTFASGTPVADAQSTFSNLIPRVDVVVNGSRVVCSVYPWLMHLHQLLATGNMGERRASAAASAATDNYPTVDQGFVYGTTGQVTTVAETVLIPFENIFAKEDQKHLTWLNLKGAASAEIKLTTAAFSKLLGYGNTAPVVYSSSTLKVEIITIEASDVSAEMQFSDWKRTTKQVSFSAETSDYAIDINRGNKLQALSVFAQDGAAGTATTASGKLASNLALTKMQLVVNGQSIIKNTNFKALQAEMRARAGVNAPFASNVSRFDGFARMDMLRGGDLRTALDLRPPLVDNCQLVVSTNTASNVSYTGPVTLTIMSEEIVSPR